MHPKSGKPPSPISPAAPTAAIDAAEADSGATPEEGEDSSSSSKPYRKDEAKTSWIEIELVDEEDQPVPGERYEITLPDGSVARGTLDQYGFARVDGIDPGNCRITFPRLDQEAWERA